MINQIHGYIDCRMPMPIECKWSATYLSLTSYDESIHFSHCYHIFRGCVPGRFVTSYSVTYYIHVPGKPGICFHYYCTVYGKCKYSDTFFACRSYSFVCTVHNLIIIIVQTYLKA